MSRALAPSQVWVAKVIIASTAIAISAALAVGSPAPIPVLAAGAALAFLVLMLWPSSAPPILLLPAAYQWSVVVLKPYQSAIERVPLQSLSLFGGDLEGAALFSLAAICALAVGMKLGAGRQQHQNRLLREEAAAWPASRILALTGAAILLGHALDIVAGFVAPARQILLALGGVRYAGLFVLTYWCLTRKRAYGYLAAFLAVEIVAGMTGFFADFRGAVLTVAIAALSARPTIRPGNIAIMVAVGVLILNVAVFWSAVKVGYRDYVNLGSGAQIVAVPITDRIDYLTSQLGEFDAIQFHNGLERLVDRHSYIDFLANALTYVPRVQPHEGGARLWQTVVHILTPRVFFPNKPPLPNDAVVTAKYTGLPIGNNPNVSISLGYVGELYVDFGYIGATIATFVLGLLYGFGVRYILKLSSGSRLFIYGLCVTSALVISSFETALIKLVGGVVMSIAATIVIGRFMLPRFAPARRMAKTHRERLAQRAEL